MIRNIKDKQQFKKSSTQSAFLLHTAKTLALSSIQQKTGLYPAHDQQTGH
jgi:hypothetical protein